MLGNYWIPQHFSQAVIVVICLALVLAIRLIKRGRDARFQ
jgi:ribose 1,5-bisphosphokinase PhnN